MDDIFLLETFSCSKSQRRKFIVILKQFGIIDRARMSNDTVKGQVTQHFGYHNHSTFNKSSRILDTKSQVQVQVHAFTFFFFSFLFFHVLLLLFPLFYILFQTQIGCSPSPVILSIIRPQSILSPMPVHALSLSLTRINIILQLEYYYGLVWHPPCLSI